MIEEAIRERFGEDAKRCERCGVPFVGDDYLCKRCRERTWETRYAENQCGNCQGRLEPGDKYCRICGTKAGEGAFEPFQTALQCLYGPRSVTRSFSCASCGHSWETTSMSVRDRYCPKCGSDAKSDSDEPESGRAPQ